MTLLRWVIKQLTNRISNQDYLNRVNQANQVQQKSTPKTDRRFQSFIDEALKETNKNHLESSSINFSNHAQKRMEQRGIQLDLSDMSNLEEAFVTLGDKGAENSLIIYDDLSLIASVKNRTIITASKTDEMTEVTNIDSAIHVKR